MTQVSVPDQHGELTSVELRRRILEFEDYTKRQPQVHIPVTQYFSRGVYVREITIPAGVIATGHIHRHACLSIVLEGKMEVVTEEGGKIIEAPMVFESPAGVKRAGRAITDCRWLTIHPWNGPELPPETMLWVHHVPRFEDLDGLEDREDYAEILAEYGVDEELVRSQSEQTHDYTDIPTMGMWRLGPSRIEGTGVFAEVCYPAGSVIGPARIGDMRTPLGRYVNHARQPNAQHIFHGRADMVMQIALADIRPGDEITNDYRRSLNLYRSIHGETTP